MVFFVFGLSYLCHQISSTLQRKLSFTIGIILFLGLGIWAVDRWSILPILPAEPTDVIPAEASVVINLPDMERILKMDGPENTNAWEKAIMSLPGFREDIQQLNLLIDTLFPSRTALDRTNGLLSLMPVGSGQLAGTWVIDLRTLGNLNPEEWLNARRLNYQTSSFRGQLVWTVTLEGQRRMAISKFRNLLIIGKLAYQVEAVLAAESREDHWMNELLPANDVDALCSVYINPHQWKDLIDHLFTQEARAIGYRWSEWLESLRIDVYAEGEGYRLEGSSLARREWLDNKIRPAANQADLWGMLPANTAGIKAINLEDHPAYFRQHARGRVGRFQRFFLPWMEGPLLELTLRPFNAKLEDRQLYFFGFTDKSNVQESLNEWMGEVGILQNIDYQGFSLTQVYESESLFPFSKESWDNPWWTIVGDYVVLATNQNTLQNWIDQYVVGSALPLTAVARQMTLSESGGQFSFFLDWKLWRTGWQYLIADQELSRAIADLGQLAFRVKTEGGRGRFSGLWMPHPPELERSGDLSWRRVLSNKVVAGPWLGTDAAGKALIMAQDATNRFYLLDDAGKIRWQQLLEERILSEVKTIELPQGKALTFNTASAIHLLDLSGNAIPPFPLRLSNPTSLPQTVIDFSDNQAFTFFTVSTDGCVYGYTLDGGAVPAWNPKCDLGNVRQALLHFQNDNKDYLVLRNEEGILRVFARDGSLRLQSDFPSGPSRSPLQYQLLGGREQIVSCTDSGLVEILPLEKAPLQLRLPVGNNLGVRMIYEDFQGDGRKDYLVSSGHTVALHVYTDRGLIRQFETSFPQPVDRVFRVSGSNKNEGSFGVLLDNNAQIYLLSEKGETLPNFPLAGNTPFIITDLFQAGEPHLIVGYQDEILAYRMPAPQ